MFAGYLFQKADTTGDLTVGYLNQISNHLRNTSDPILGYTTLAAEMGVHFAAAMSLLGSLSLVLLDSVLALLLKLSLHDYKRHLKPFHNPEEQVINRELYAHGLRRWAIPSLFELLFSLIHYSLVLFLVGAVCSLLRLGEIIITAGIMIIGSFC